MRPISEKPRVEKGAHRSREQCRTAHPVCFQRVDIDRMTLDSGGPVRSRMIDGGSEQRRRDSDSTVSLVDGKADHPPSPRIIRQYPAERSVALNPRHLTTGHDATPPDRNAIDICEHPGRHDGSGDLGAEGLTIVRRARAIWRFEQPLAPTPARIVAAATERDHDVVPVLGGRGNGLELHDAAGTVTDRLLRTQRTRSTRSTYCALVH